MTDTIVVAGAGHAAGQLATSLRQKGFDGQIVLIGEEDYIPYQRPPLSKKFLAGEMPLERLYFKPAAYYETHDVALRLSTRIQAIDRANKRVQCADGESIAYDKLVLATGARVRRLSLPGADLPGIHYLRNIDDVLGMQKAMQAGSRLVIIGAGYIGLEVAAVAAQLGVDVTVVEAEKRVLSRVVSPQLSEFYQQEHTAHGVKLRLATGVKAFIGDHHIQSVELSNGEQLDADLVVVGIGVLPNVELAESCGLAVNDGIVVDDHCRTDDPDIFAIGDCTMHPNALLGRSLRLESVHNAVEQAKTAAANLLGEDVGYTQVPWFWSDQYDLKLQIVGMSQGYDEVVTRGNPEQRSFACLYLQQGRLIAVDAVNNPRDFMQAKALIAAGCHPDVTRLADPAIALKDFA